MMKIRTQPKTHIHHANEHRWVRTEADWFEQNGILSRVKRERERDREKQTDRERDAKEDKITKSHTHRKHEPEVKGKRKISFVLKRCSSDDQEKNKIRNVGK